MLFISSSKEIERALAYILPDGCTQPKIFPGSPRIEYAGNLQIFEQGVFKDCRCLLSKNFAHLWPLCSPSSPSKESPFARPSRLSFPIEHAVLRVFVESKVPFLLEIITPERIYRFRATSRLDLAEWIIAIASHSNVISDNDTLDALDSEIARVEFEGSHP
mmetsp:Transcript_23210/g.38167  ORF Transcript_23210/g.38167 Transcript_23210/m.38167 type:complete len:161 (-) Transcript_23210:310-792(-)